MRAVRPGETAERHVTLRGVPARQVAADLLDQRCCQDALRVAETEPPAVAGAFATQGFVFISLTTRLPAFSDRWSLVGGRAVAAAPRLVLLAGVGTLLAERLAPRVGSARAAAGLARGGIAVTVPVATLAPEVAVFAAAVAGYGVALGVGRRRDQHAGGGAGAPLRAADPAVVPRRLDGRRPGRPRRSRWRPPTSTCGGWPCSPWCRSSPSWRRTSPRRRAGAPGRRRRAVAADPPGRGGAGALLHGRHRGVHLGADLPRRAVADARPGRAGDLPVPAGERARATGRRRPGTAIRAGPRAAGRAWCRPALAVIVFAPTWPVAVLGFLSSAPGSRSWRR